MLSRKKQEKWLIDLEGDSSSQQFQSFYIAQAAVEVQETITFGSYGSEIVMESSSRVVFFFIHLPPHDFQK